MSMYFCYDSTKEATKSDEIPPNLTAILLEIFLIESIVLFFIRYSPSCEWQLLNLIRSTENQMFQY